MVANPYPCHDFGYYRNSWSYLDIYNTASRNARKAQEELTLTIVKETTAVNDLLNKLQEANINREKKESK